MKKTIHLVTTNPGKVLSTQKTLKHFGIGVRHANHELIEPQSDDLELIAKTKAKQAFELTGKPCIAIDAGLWIHAFDGYPGPYAKKFLTLKLHRILRLMQGEPRECLFQDCVAYADANTLVSFLGPIPGVISETTRGKIQKWSWSELDLIFVPEGESKTLGEMTRAERDAWRMRRGDGALIQFAKWYQSRPT